LQGDGVGIAFEMKDSIKPVIFLCFGVVIGTVALWLLIGQFLGSTRGIAVDLAIRHSQATTSENREPLSIDRVRKSELEMQLQDTLGSTEEQKRDAADSAVRNASVQSKTLAGKTERADSDDDIVTQKSIRQLEQQLDAATAVQTTDLNEVLSQEPGGTLSQALPEALPDALVQNDEPSASLGLDAVIPEGPVRALEVSLDLAEHCKDQRAAGFRVGVLFRRGSAAIKGRSLTDLDLIVEAGKTCKPSTVIVETIPLPGPEGESGISERRADEIKYYLLQRGVDKQLMRFQDRS